MVYIIYIFCRRFLCLHPEVARSIMVSGFPVGKLFLLFLVQPTSGNTKARRFRETPSATSTSPDIPTETVKVCMLYFYASALR